MRKRISLRRLKHPRPYAIRKPQGYQVQEPGDLVEVHTKATSTTAVGFLETLTKRMPFPIKALQVDGGSEFQAAFSHGIL